MYSTSYLHVRDAEPSIISVHSLSTYLFSKAPSTLQTSLSSRLNIHVRISRQIKLHPYRVHLYVVRPSIVVQIPGK